MLKVNYNFRALSPIHHGADADLGIIKMLRKNKVFGVNREVFSRFGFGSEKTKLKYKAVTFILLKLWEKMDKKDRFTIYEEITGKLLASAYSRSKYEFIESLCAKLEVRSATVPNQSELSIVDVIDMFSDYELLDLVRNGSIYIVAYFKQIKEAINEEKKAEIDTTYKQLVNDLLAYKDVPYKSEIIQNNYEFVPLISGNSIRGMLRREIMEHYCETIGLKTLSPRNYHMLFTGGTLQKDKKGSGFEDIGKRESLLEICPPLRLFGAAIGMQTIQGDLRVSPASLKCIENKNGVNSLHDLTEITYSTRLDSAKTERNIEFTEKDNETHQMKYYLEMFCVGAEFEHSFSCVSSNEQSVNVFNQMLYIFTQKNHISAKESIGFGDIDNSELEKYIDNTKRQSYIDYLEANKAKILEFWNTL